MAKFIQTIDESKILTIINLEAISHAHRFPDGALQIYFEQSRVVILVEEQANIVWEFLKAASWQVYESQEDKKEGDD